MDFLESNMTTVMIAVVIAMLSVGLMYWRRREGLENEEDLEEAEEGEEEEAEEEEEEDE